MKLIWKILAVPFLVIFIAVGCTGISQLDMNAELSSLHAQRVAMQNEITANQKDDRNTEKVRDRELLLADIDNSFIELAGRAAKSAMAAEEKGDKLNAVSLYRIAAVAAWLGEAPNLTEYTDKGTTACDQLQGGIGAAPRDCAMLKTIPYLAVNAASASELEVISVEEIKLKRIRDEDFIKWIEEIKRTKIRDRTEQTFNDFHAAAVQIVRVQQELGSIANASSPRFIEALGMRAFTVACNANYAFVILENLTLPDDFDESRIPADLRPEMQRWSQGFKKAKGLKTDLDNMLPTKANAKNCEGL
jgi:hypothetical protein